MQSNKLNRFLEDLTTAFLSVTKQEDLQSILDAPFWKSLDLQLLCICLNDKNKNEEAFIFRSAEKHSDEIKNELCIGESLLNNVSQKSVTSNSGNTTYSESSNHLHFTINPDKNFSLKCIIGKSSQNIPEYLKVLISSLLGSTFQKLFPFNTDTGFTAKSLVEEMPANILSQTQINYNTEADELKNYYYKLLNDIPGQIAVFDKDLRYKFVNPESVKDESIRNWLIGKNDLEYCEYRGLDPSVGIDRQVSLRKALQEKKRLSFVEKVSKPSGDTLYFYRVISPIFDNNQEVESLIGYGVDITEQKMAEYERDRFFNLSLDILCIANIDGYFKRINPAIEKMLGFKIDELLAKPIIEFISKEDSEKTKAMFNDLKLNKQVSNFENRFVCKDGAERWFSWKAVKVPESPYVYGVLRDITEQKWIEQELINAKTLAEDSTKAKEEFLAHMSHEIRTPLNAIIGLTDFMIENKMQERQYEYLGTVKSAADNLLLLINDILDFSKINSGKIEFENAEFSLEEIIKKNVQIIEIRALEKNISLSMEYAVDIPKVLIGDENRINQIIMNFLSNAVKFTNEGGVSISAKLERNNLPDEMVEISLSVADSGIGIPQDKLEHIFDSFAQVKTSGYTSIQGAGLGLTITRKLVELLNGKISVESSIGKGSVFTALIQLKKSKRTVLETVDISSTMMNDKLLIDKNILVVEDNELNQIVVSNFLKKWGAKYSIAGNGEVALNFLESKNFDLILMDLAMPVMNGYEATHYIRNKLASPVKSIPIIALTASAVIDVKRKTLRSGMNDYLQKPFRPYELLSKILLWIEGGESAVLLAQAESESASSSDNKIDLSYLKEVADDSESLLLSMLIDIKKNIVVFFTTIAKNVVEDNIKEIKTNTHKIKPVFSYIGSNLLAEKIIELENLTVGDYDISKISEMIIEMEVIWREVEKLLTIETDILKLKIPPENV